MECRMFEVTLVSAQSLENVRRFFTNRVRVYAKVSLGDNLRTAKRTPDDKEGQTNPVWDFKATYTIGKNAVKSQDTKLLVQLYCIRTVQDTDIGEVSVPLKELFDRFSTLPKGEDTAKVNYPVTRGDADSQGEVSLSYKFGDVFVFEPPSIDWGKLLWKGTKFLTKFIFKGGVLCIRLTLLANGNVFDFPIDSVADIAYTSYDFLSQIFGIGGDWMADIPWGEADFPTDIYPEVEDAASNLQTNVDEEWNVPSDSSIDVPTDSIDVLAESSMPWVETDLLVDVLCPEADIPMAEDAVSNLQTNVDAESIMLLDVLYMPLGEADFPVDISCPGADIPLAEDATSSLQTNVYEGSNVLDDSTSVPADSANAYVHTAMDATSIVRTDEFGGSNVQADGTNFYAESNYVFTDSTSATTNLLVDVLCCLPTTQRDARDDATFSVETNVSADVPFSGEDHVPTAVDATSCEVSMDAPSCEISMDATFSTEINMAGDVSCLKSNVVVDVTSIDETNAGSDVSFLDADIGKTNMMADIPCFEANGWEDATFIIGEMASETSCLQGDIRADDAFDGKTKKTDNVSGLEANTEQDAIANGETMEYIPCLEGVIGVNDAPNGETNKIADISGLEEDVEEDAIVNGETIEDILCLEEDVDQDISFLEGDIGANDASDGEPNKIANVSGLEEDIEENSIANGETMEYFSSLEGNIGVDDTSDGETNKINDSGLEGDAKEDDIANGETMEDIPYSKGDIGANDAFDGETNKTDNVSSLEGDVEEDAIVDGQTMEEEDIPSLEEEVEVDGTFNCEIDATNYILGLMSNVRNLVNYLRAKLHLIIILFLFLFMLPILFSFFIVYLWFTN